MALQCLVEVDQHDHADLHGHAGERDEADADGDRHVVAKQVKQPVATDQCQWQGAHDDEYLGEAAEVEVQQQHDNTERDR